LIVPWDPPNFASRCWLHYDVKSMHGCTVRFWLEFICNFWLCIQREFYRVWGYSIYRSVRYLEAINTNHYFEFQELNIYFINTVEW